MSIVVVAEALVRMVKGRTTYQFILPTGVNASKIVKLDDDTAVVARRIEPPDPARLIIASITIGEESENWRETGKREKSKSYTDCRQWFDGPLNVDPCFDITVINRSGEPVLLTAVGLEILSLDFDQKTYGGGVAVFEVKRSRTFCLELPDMWRKLAEAKLSQQLERPVKVQELAFSRLPDPVLLEVNAPYRYGLLLYDYQELLPNKVVLCFWLQTDRGEIRSHKVYVSYIIPGGYRGVSRYYMLTNREDSIRYRANRLWEQSDRPEGQGDQLWLAAEQEQQREDVERLRDHQLRKRPI